MNEPPQITPEERRALDELGANFDALLARTPEPAPRIRRRGFALAGGIAVAGLLALVVWAAWPGDSTVDSAQGDISDVAAHQAAPAPTQFVESESVTTNLVRTPRRELRENAIAQHAWLSMARPGVIETRAYFKGPGDPLNDRFVTRVRPIPVYRIAGKVYTPREIAAFTKKPDGLIAEIDAKVAELPARFRPATKWKYLIEPLRAIAPPLPSSIRAAMIQQLETLPGVRGPVKTRDPRQRDGLELNLDDDSLGFTLGVIFDPDDAQILYTDSVFKDPRLSGNRDAKVGQTFTSYLLISSRVVDSAPRVVSKSK